ncbi:unnamed protein product [Moneuplotes crassus]|uniref:Uncharacterized protein n=1 Tax=Euplotes crassus TaxID=5936 RepID=A0AAD2CZX9_EUPCR|nr:unnamed protein product [Moneuplotes crassus]
MQKSSQTPIPYQKSIPKAKHPSPTPFQTLSLKSPLAKKPPSNLKALQLPSLIVLEKERKLASVAFHAIAEEYKIDYSAKFGSCIVYEDYCRKKVFCRNFRVLMKMKTGGEGDRLRVIGTKIRKNDLQRLLGQKYAHFDRIEFFQTILGRRTLINGAFIINSFVKICSKTLKNINIWNLSLSHKNFANIILMNHICQSIEFIDCIILEGKLKSKLDKKSSLKKIRFYNNEGYLLNIESIKCIVHNLSLCLSCNVKIFINNSKSDPEYCDQLQSIVENTKFEIHLESDL